MKKLLIFTGIVAAVLGGAYGFYQYNKPHKNLTHIKEDVTISALSLFEAYQTDENAANSRFLGKVVAVSGLVSAVESDTGGVVKVTLDRSDADGFGVICQLSTTVPHLPVIFDVGDNVGFKGVCSGFNFDVQLVDCVEIAVVHEDLK